MSKTHDYQPTPVYIVDSDGNELDPLPTSGGGGGGGDATAANQVLQTTELEDINTALDGTLVVDTGLAQGLTDTELRASDVQVKPQMASGGNLSVETAATGTNFVAFASQALKQLTICNDTGTKLEVRQGGAGVAFTIIDGSYYTFFGITNADQLDVRRKDTSNTQVTATARWES